MPLLSFTQMRSGSVILAAVAMLTGCSGIADDAPPLEKYGAVNFLGKRTGSNTASAVTTVVFFEAVGLQIPNSSLQQTDQCVFSPVDTLPTAARGDRKAGSAIGITVGGSTRQLTYVDAEQRYITPVGQPIRYAVGDVGQVTVPGDGTNFPAISGSVKLVEPLEVGPVVVPAAGQNMSVTWNGTNDPTAAIILQLKYPNPAATSFANEQVYCALKDDGAVVIPGGLLTQFQAAGTRRSLTLVRWRTNLVSNNDARLHLTSSIDTTVVIP
jgi:hypothetical protein